MTSDEKLEKRYFFLTIRMTCILMDNFFSCYSIIRRRLQLLYMQHRGAAEVSFMIQYINVK